MNVVEDRLGEDIILLDVRDVSPFTDFFVICSGNSERQLKALVEAVHGMCKEVGIYPHHIEGEPLSGWVLMDYVDVIVHLFAPELRAYYDLEELWHQGKTLLRIQ